MEMPVEQSDLRDYVFLEFTPLSVGDLAETPALELGDVPGVELRWIPLLLNPEGSQAGPSGFSPLGWVQ